VRVVRQGFPYVGLVFDRPEGGERLFGNEVKHVSGYTLPVHIPGDIVHVINFMWPY
jgi:hypothetical protein